MSTSQHLTYAPAGRLRGLWNSAGLSEVEERMNRLVGGEAPGGLLGLRVMAEGDDVPLRPTMDPLGPMVRDHLATGGKRLRARLALGCADVLGCDRRDAVGWAVACELLHNASLIHDDLQDGDRTRRGRPALWATHGVAQAINAGDLCLMLPYVALDGVPRPAEVKWDLALFLAAHAERMVRGQAAELELLERRRLDWASYAESVIGKTASLFVLPVLGAARIAGRSREEAERLGRQFRAIGLLFQVQDDLLDLWGDKGRGEVGSDLKEGKVSALVVEHLRLVPSDTPWLLHLLETPRAETTDAAVASAIARFESSGALDAVWDRIDVLEDEIVSSPVLERDPRLHALAIELVAQALSPVASTAPPRSA